MKNKKVAIIIVNWNGLKFLNDCLNAVYKQTYKNFDIYFVDNGSYDESVKYVLNNFPKIKVISLEDNTGFARGNNIGIREAFKDKDIKYIVCLNNDTKVKNNWLYELIKTASSDKKIGAVGSKILFYNREKTINSVGIIPLKNGNALNYGKNTSYSNFNKTEIIFGPCAASALYTRECLEKVGLFDEKYFCYLEDVDLAWRINLAGFKSVLNPNSLIYHIHSGSSKNNSFKKYLIVRNSLYNLIKYMSFKEIIFYIPNTILYHNLLKNKENIGEEVTKSSKFNFIINNFKALPILFFKLPQLLFQRYEINRNIQKISSNEKRNLINKFWIKYE